MFAIDVHPAGPADVDAGQFGFEASQLVVLEVVIIEDEVAEVGAAAEFFGESAQGLAVEVGEDDLIGSGLDFGEVGVGRAVEGGSAAWIELEGIGVDSEQFEQVAGGLGVGSASESVGESGGVTDDGEPEGPHQGLSGEAGEAVGVEAADEGRGGGGGGGLFERFEAEVGQGGVGAWCGGFEEAVAQCDALFERRRFEEALEDDRGRVTGEGREAFGEAGGARGFGVGEPSVGQEAADCVEGSVAPVGFGIGQGGAIRFLCGRVVDEFEGPGAGVGQSFVEVVGVGHVVDGRQDRTRRAMLQGGWGWGEWVGLSAG